MGKDHHASSTKGPLTTGKHPLLRPFNSKTKDRDMRIILPAIREDKNANEVVREQASQPFSFYSGSLMSGTL
jgi:hypothetical protein